MYSNQDEISPKIWLYAIHGNNFKIINFLEENHILPENLNYEKCLKESIKCHHNDISNYIIDNYIEEKDTFNFDENI